MPKDVTSAILNTVEGAEDAISIVMDYGSLKSIKQNLDMNEKESGNTP